MPTFRHGRLGYMDIQQLNSTQLNVSDVLRSIALNITLDTPETTAFGSTFKSYVVGIKDGKFSCQGMFSATEDAAFNAIYGVDGPTSGQDFTDGYAGFLVRYSPEAVGGTTLTSGLVKYCFRAHLATYNTTGAVGDMVAIQADFVVTSAVIRDTAATWTYTGGGFTVSGGTSTLEPQTDTLGA